MRFNEVTLNGGAKDKRHSSLPAFRLLLAALLMLSTVAAAGNHRKSSGHSRPTGRYNGHYKKIAADLSKFTINPDGTVDVIIQFKDTPQMYHFR